MAQTEIAPRPMAPRPADVAGQIKQDLEAFARDWNRYFSVADNSREFELTGSYRIHGARAGYFGAGRRVARSASRFR